MRILLKGLNLTKYNILQVAGQALYTSTDSSKVIFKLFTQVRNAEKLELELGTAHQAINGRTRAVYCIWGPAPEGHLDVQLTEKR